MAEDKKSGTKTDNSVVGLEIQKGHIKLCVANYSGRANPSFRFLTLELPKEAAEPGSSLAGFLAQNGIVVEKAFLNIPRHRVMARVFHLPSVNEEEIKSMVKMEAIKQMPYRDDDVIMGHRIIEKLKDGYSDVFLAVSHVEMIQRQVKILNQAGLAIDKIALSSESLFSWHSAIVEKSRRHARLNLALVNVDSSYVDMDIIEKGKLIFARAFSYDPAQEGVVRNIADEVRKSIAIYQKERNVKIDKILITGAEEQTRLVEAALKEEAGDSVERIAQTEGIELAENADKAMGGNSFVELIGLLLRSGDAKINFLPQRMKDDKEFLIFRSAVTRTLVLFAFVATAFIGILGQKLFEKHTILRRFNTEIKTIEPRVEAANKMRADLKIIKKDILRKPLAIDVLAEVYRITPTDISFNLMDYDTGKSLVLRGNGPSLDGIIRYISALEASGYFENVKLKYTTKRSFRGREKTDFEVVCLLKNGKS